MEVEYPQLESAIREVFSIHGVEALEAATLARELTDATFAGYESHGIGRVKSYVQALQDGSVQAGARLRIVRETPAGGLVDGSGGFGILMALQAADRVSAIARGTGMGALALRNCGDVARLAPYAERIARDGAIGIVMANDAGSGLVVAPHGGTEPILSTNPMAAGIPRLDQPPLVFDMATSQIAVGAARAAARRGASLPPDTLIGPGGEEITDPAALFSGLAALLPLGGLAFGFKGTALGLLVEILAGGLSGDGLSGDHPDRHGRNAVFMLALRPESFVELPGFHAAVEAFLARLRASRARSGVQSVRVPGEPTARPGHISLLDSLWKELMDFRNQRSGKP